MLNESFRTLDNCSFTSQVPGMIQTNITYTGKGKVKLSPKQYVLKTNDDPCLKGVSFTTNNLECRCLYL